MSKSTEQLDLAGSKVFHQNKESFQNLRPPSNLLSKSVPFEDEIKNNNENMYQSTSNIRNQRTKKTPYEMFLEDDGPYSRRLFTPVPNEARNSTNEFKSNCEVHDNKKDKIIQKGLLWHKGERLFAR